MGSSMDSMKILLNCFNLPFSKWRHLTTTTTIQFAFLFKFKFCNSSGEQRTIALICMRKQKLKDSGSYSQMIL